MPIPWRTLLRIESLYIGPISLIFFSEVHLSLSPIEIYPLLKFFNFTFASY